jgi:F-type H+-transporting ATPase subunit alpha
MKQVAGRLRLDMSQFREKEAFAQFGTELDKTTLQQLERGKRLVEILKQDQYRPMSVEDQVAIIYCGANGLVDDIPTEDIRRFEEEFLSDIKDKAKDILISIKEEKQITKKTEEKIKQALKEFKSLFVFSDDKQNISSEEDKNTETNSSNKK